MGLAVFTKYDDLSPTQQLILEVLAARFRLGDKLWPFDTRNKHQANLLEEYGLIQVHTGNVERTFRASLTAAGQKLLLDPTYTVRTDEATVEVPKAAGGVTLHLGRNSDNLLQPVLHPNGDQLLATIHAPMRVAMMNKFIDGVENSLCPAGHELFLASPTRDGELFCVTSRPAVRISTGVQPSDVDEIPAEPGVDPYGQKES
jgi:hypothetical protein